MTKKADVLFLYASKGVAQAPSDTWKSHQAGSRYKHNGQEGYFSMFKHLLDKKIISKLTAVYESNVEPGIADFVKGADNYVIPRLSHEILKPLIGPDTIIFVRGGFKHWVELLEPYLGLNWLLMYAANTGRERWKWWDVVFDDLTLKNEVDSHGRYFFPFIKPVNEDIFKFYKCPKVYDICIGASYIHDKKGQYLAVQLIEAFQKKYGYLPDCIMPGVPRRSLYTLKMLETDFTKNDCIMPGMVNRKRLAKIFNQSKVFIHLGPGGQNDRSLAEAWACGCKLIYRNRDRFSPYFMYNGLDNYLFKSDNLEENVCKLKAILDSTVYYGDNDYIEQQMIINKYKKHMGFNEKVMPRVELLIKTINQLTGPNLKNKNRLLGVMEKLFYQI